MTALAAVQALKTETDALLRAENDARNCRDATKSKELLAAWYEKKMELDAIAKLLKH